MWGGRRRVSSINDRMIPGVPDVFTGKDTTYGMARVMAEDVRDQSCQTGVEKGLAITLLAVIEDFEKELNNREKK